MYRVGHDLIVFCIKKRLQEVVELSKDPITQIYSDSGGIYLWLKPGTYFKFEIK